MTIQKATGIAFAFSSQRVTQKTVERTSDFEITQHHHELFDREWSRTGFNVSQGPGERLHFRSTASGPDDHNAGINPLASVY